MKQSKWGLLLLLFLGLISCGDDELSDPEITVNDFTASIDENPTSGDVIGTVSASTTEGELTYSLSNLSAVRAIAINESTGQITVEEEGAFDFESRTEITAEFIASTEGKSEKANVTIAINDVDEGGGPPQFNIWTGPTTTFTKADNADPGSESNQDRLTDLVWITRNNDSGQIYNAVTETEADKNTSPAGTEWAIGTTSNVAALTFQPFRAAVGKPKDAVGTDLVLHLIQDDIYIDLKITSWSQGGGGGFAYERSTPQ